MSLVLNTNIASLNAQNNLTGSQASLVAVLAAPVFGLAHQQRGRRRRRPRDQPAIHHADQRHEPGRHNANDAVSETQTTAGALEDHRQQPAEHPHPGGRSPPTVRTAPRIAPRSNNQVQQQISEITQIASQTTFNGLNVLNGSSGTTTYQVGPMSATPSRSACRRVWRRTRSASTRRTARAASDRRPHQRVFGDVGDGASTVTVGPTANYVGSQRLPEFDFRLRQAQRRQRAGLQGLTASASTTTAACGVRVRAVRRRGRRHLLH